MRIATADLETDPFQYGRVVTPFCAGWYDSQRFITWWDADCVSQLLTFLENEMEPWTIYVHNGGRFDFFFMLSRFIGELHIINNRIVSAQFGIHQFRDSYAILPFALAEYQKDTIDYQRLEAAERENHREEIVRYLRGDCVYLHELVSSFIAEFGDKLTVGSASMKEIRKRHKFSRGGKPYDDKIRHRFYFGGRNQVFQSGVIRGDIRVYDVNSMYPFAMENSLHPVSCGMWEDTQITNATTFVVCQGKNHGAFPIRTKTGGLDFTSTSGTYYVTIHEWHAALDCGMFEPSKIIATVNHMERGTFGEFVQHFYLARQHAAAIGDAARKLAFKYVLNSGYGKFAQNPENYFDWRIAKIGHTFDDWHDCTVACESSCLHVWEPAFRNAGYIIWRRPIEVQSRYNVATGASITGAARALLMRGLHATGESVYCDTDSIICRGASSVEVHDSRLGAWKCEATGQMVAIAGKKLYALFDSEDNPVVDEKGREKKACKGGNLSSRQILEVARGEEIETRIDAPAFKFDGSVSFTKRMIRRTAYA